MADNDVGDVACVDDVDPVIQHHGDLALHESRHPTLRPRLRIPRSEACRRAHDDAFEAAARRLREPAASMIFLTSK